MKPLYHTTAKTSYYNTRAQYYDEFNEHNAQAVNIILEKILKEHNVSTVLDLTCGTGSQVFWLIDAGLQVVGSDINPRMLTIAKQKAKQKHLDVKFLQGDCRTISVGTFDAVITIFNAIGHLTREDFQQALQNINNNLKVGGLYIFDIFNLDYLKHDDTIKKLTIDWQTISHGKKIREIQFSTITDDGVLASYSTYVHQEGFSQPTKISKGYGNTLQCYTADELKAMLQQSGFITLKQTGIDGKEFSQTKTERILTVAKKI
jgi:ubiquinone/menaquinone biosynthesis C-methylase UbiE